MNRTTPLTAALASVVAIRDAQGGIIGSGVVVAEDSVLTALHVTSEQPLSSLQVGDAPARTVESLPTWRFGRSWRQARVSHRRSVILTGIETNTVDLAHMMVPGLGVPAAPVRRQPVQPGELVAIAGFPNGQWTVSVGPVTSTDDADYVAHVLLGPGSSGAPAIDGNGQVCGLLTLDHLTAGAILIGPRLLTTFIDHIRRCPWCE